ncbi:MAG: hypothetical protein ACYTFE_07600 [Planctomycetota bacterium]|jgi:hypothetical protein
MKKMINVEVKARKVEPDLSKCKTDLLVIGMFADKALDKLCKQLDINLDGAIEKLNTLGDFKGKEGTVPLFTVIRESRLTGCCLWGWEKAKKPVLMLFEKQPVSLQKKQLK